MHGYLNERSYQVASRMIIVECFHNDVVTESIKCLDREQLKDINFSVHSENVDTSLIRQRLCNIFDNKCNEFEASSTCNFNTHETRKSRIGFVYALLNLPASNSNEVLITKNIEIIADQENKTGEEMQLLDYIFRNEGKFGLKMVRLSNV